MYEQLSQDETGNGLHIEIAACDPQLTVLFVR
jgi:hypothetical protein